MVVGIPVLGKLPRYRRVLETSDMAEARGGVMDGHTDEGILLIAGRSAHSWWTLGSCATWNGGGISWTSQVVM